MKQILHGREQLQVLFPKRNSQEGSQLWIPRGIWQIKSGCSSGKQKMQKRRDVKEPLQGETPDKLSEIQSPKLNQRGTASTVLALS